MAPPRELPPSPLRTAQACILSAFNILHSLSHPFSLNLPSTYLVGHLGEEPRHVLRRAVVARDRVHHLRQRTHDDAMTTMTTTTTEAENSEVERK